MPQDTSGQVQSHVKPNFELKEFKSIFHFDRGFQPRLPEAEKVFGFSSLFLEGVLKDVVMNASEVREPKECSLLKI